MGGISFITMGVKRCFGVLRDNYQTNSSVKLGTIHLGQRLAPLAALSTEVQRSTGARNSLGIQGKFPFIKKNEERRSRLKELCEMW